MHHAEVEAAEEAAEVEAAVEAAEEAHPAKMLLRKQEVALRIGNLSWLAGNLSWEPKLGSSLGSTVTYLLPPLRQLLVRAEEAPPAKILLQTHEVAPRIGNLSWLIGNLSCEPKLGTEIGNRNWERKLGIVIGKHSYVPAPISPCSASLFLFFFLFFFINPL